MNIAIGSDHRGFQLKENLIKYLKENNFQVNDVGTNNAESVDYPDFAAKVCKSVLNNESAFGIAICGSGIGVSIASNKVKGIRAVNANTKDLTVMSRKHNDANVICFGADFIDFQTAIKFLDLFLNTEFEGGERHERRINKLNGMCS